MTDLRQGTERSDATRERILDAAAKTLSLKGYSQSKLSDIAKRADLRSPAVYYYFDSRDELIAEVMRVGQQRVREHVDRALAAMPDGTPPLDLIDAAVEAHLLVELDLSDYATAVTRNVGHMPPAILDELQRESDAYHSMWRDLIRHASDEGALRADLDPAVTRMLIIGALNWAAEWWTPERSLPDLIATAQSIVRHAISI